MSDRPYIYYTDRFSTISIYETGHIIDTQNDNIGYKCLCGKWYKWNDEKDFERRERAQPGVQLCQKCKEVRKQKGRKRQPARAVTADDLKRWNEAIGGK